MLSLADVRQWKPAELDGVFAVLGAHREALITLDDDLAVVRNPAGWAGVAAPAAAANLDRLTERMRRIVAGVARVRRAVGDTADAVIELQRALAEAEALARFHGLVIGPDGTVIEVAPPADQTAPMAQERAAVQSAVIGLVQQVLRGAEQVDADLTAVLRAAARFEIDDNTTLAAAAGGLSARVPPGGATPQQVADWWSSLSDAERTILVASRPELLGNLDGLPAEVRDSANRSRIPEERGALQAQLTQLQAAASGGELSAGAQLGQVRNKLRALDALDATLARGDRQLLLLDTWGRRVKAAVAIGDVDKATHVAVFTPGFTSTVEDSLTGYDDQISLMRRQAEDESQRHGGKDSVAAVTWIGYEAPQSGEVVDPDRSVAGEHQARAGGKALARFLDGIDAARPVDPHLTVIGHSYGSTVTGYAVEQAVGVDDVIFCGSPGIGTSNVGALRVPEGHAYVIEAKDDPVADLGWFGHDPNQLDDLTDLYSGASTNLDGERLQEVTGHSNYLTPNSTSQYNMSIVVAGLADWEIYGENTGFGDHAREFLDEVGDVVHDSVKIGRRIVGGAVETSRDVVNKMRDIVPGI
ncbi:MAG: alpha/beta hydrolase [Pseudonocardiaceae bacterium]